MVSFALYALSHGVQPSVELRTAVLDELSQLEAHSCHIAAVDGEYDRVVNPCDLLEKQYQADTDCGNER